MAKKSQKYHCPTKILGSMTLKEECDNIHRIRATVVLALDATDSMTHATDFVAPTLENLSHGATAGYKNQSSTYLPKTLFLQVKRFIMMIYMYLNEITLFRLLL